MTTYGSFGKLKGKTLKIGDTIIFKKGTSKIKVRVDGNFLNYPSGDNYTPLNMVGYRTRSSRSVFCSENYGYDCTGGDWPEYKDGDMEAITRTVLKMFQILEKNFSWRDKYEKPNKI